MLHKKHHSLTFQISKIEEDFAVMFVGIYTGSNAAGAVVNESAAESVSGCADTVLF